MRIGVIGLGRAGSMMLRAMVRHPDIQVTAAADVHQQHLARFQEDFGRLGCQESMGAIADRTREHLGSSDLSIIRIRRRLIAAAQMLRAEGIAPPGSLEPACFGVRSASVVLPRTEQWLDGAADVLTAVPGVNFPAV
jgi:hypothetical protein